MNKKWVFLLEKEKLQCKRKLIMWVVIGVLFLVALYLVFQAGSGSTGKSISSSRKIDTTGWTEDEIMNYEMHGIIPAGTTGSATSSSSGSGMVGGC